MHAWTHGYDHVHLTYTYMIQMNIHIVIYSADEDYDSDVIEVTFNPGDTRMTISINITDDSIDEEDEAFALDLTRTSATPDTLEIAGPTTAFGIIEDNDNIGTYV